LWSLSFEEREMLKRYALYYWCEYRDVQVQLKRQSSLQKEGQKTTHVIILCLRQNNI